MSTSAQNTQNAQDCKGIEALNLYDRLEMHYRIAIDLRLLLYKHAEIAKTIRQELHIKCSEYSVRHWFAEGGVCYEGYQYKLELFQKEASEGLKEVKHLIKWAAPGALRTLINQSHNKESIQASELLLGYANILKGQVVELEPLTDPFASARELLEEMKKDRLAREKDENSTDAPPVL